MAELDPLWLDRLRVVGRAQARYLWILLVTMVFYAALQLRTATSPGTAALKVPLVDIEISAAATLASGTAVLSFLVLAVRGTMRAYRRAREKLGLSAGADWSAEELDTSPNAIDFALYTTPESPKTLATIVAHFGYAFFLLVTLAEAAWLWWNLVAARTVSLWQVFALLGALLWLAAFWQVTFICYRRIRDIPTLLRTTK